ncbi:MAG: histidine--tRNA ligase [Ignavibacteriales bacterium]|nr:histidine--tRNA ligase [Ignavibacteriales bacterium]
MALKSIKGTKDILPSESYRWQTVERQIRDIMNAFNYREIRTPVFEETALFTRGIGELTDIVGKEMYSFTDRGGTSLTLKPEMTASVVRSYIQHNLGELQPLSKLYYIAPMFRQERPQAGRLRQFHQFGAEAIGGMNAEVDAEVISLAISVYEQLGVKNISVRINSVGCQVCRPIYKKVLQEFLQEVFDKLSPLSQQRFEQNPLRILDSKDENDKTLTQSAPLMKDYLCEDCAAHFTFLQNSLLSLGTNFEVDGRIVRGLDYYTKTAFEILSTDLGSQDALAGGGRYDLLIKQLGGKETPAVGFAAGIERLLMVLEKQNLFNEDDVHPNVFFVSADEKGKKWIFHQLNELRRGGIRCDMDFLGRSLKAQMREADRQKADFVIVVGEQELNDGHLQIKQMKTGEQQRVAMNELQSVLVRLVAGK